MIHLKCLGPRCTQLYADEAEVSTPEPDSLFVAPGLSPEALVTPNTKGYSEDELESRRQQELAMQEQDENITVLLAKRN